MPSGKSISFPVTNINGWSDEYVAPSDGYVCIVGKSSCTYGCASIYGVGVRATSISDLGYVCVTVPAKKGASFNYELRAGSASDVTVSFISTVGSAS